MQVAYFLIGLVPPVILLAVALKRHQRKKLNGLLLAGIILVPLAAIPAALLMILGAGQVQDLLLQLFPEANDPQTTFLSSMEVDSIEVGPIYLVVMQLSYSLPGLALFVFGLGFFINARRQARIHQESNIPSHVH